MNTPHDLLDHWIQDKNGRKILYERFNEAVSSNKLDSKEEYETVLKMMAEDITVLRWFVEKLLYEAKNNADRAKGNPD